METTVTVSFTDTSGRQVRAVYTDRARAGGKKAGQTIQIVYDPATPTSISPVGSDPRWGGAFLVGLGVVAYLGFPSPSRTAPGARVRNTLMAIES